MHTILFICTANRCRSPVAEALFKRHTQTEKLARRGAGAAQAATAGWLVRSAGTWAQPGQPAHPKTLAAARDHGLDLQSHRACGVDEIRPLGFFRLILTMEFGHKESLCYEFPEIADRVYLLSEVVGQQFEIHDPVGRSLDRHRAMIHQIDQIFVHGFPRLLEMAGGRVGQP